MSCKKDYADIEHAEVRQDIEQVKFAIDNELSTLDSTLLDWSTWDDTYYFAQGNNSAYIEENLPKETYQTLDLNFLLMFNRSGDLIYAKAYDQNTGDLEPVSPLLLNKIIENHPLFGFESPDRSASVQGIFFADNQPRFVAVRPILKNNGDGPAEGILVMGRNFDEGRMDKISKSTGVSVTLIDSATLSQTPSTGPIRDPFTTENFRVNYPENSDIIEGYTQLKQLSVTPGNVYSGGERTPGYLPERDFDDLFIPVHCPPRCADLWNPWLNVNRSISLVKGQYHHDRCPKDWI